MNNKTLTALPNPFHSSSSHPVFFDFLGDFAAGVLSFFAPLEKLIVLDAVFPPLLLLLACASTAVS